MGPNYNRSPDRAGVVSKLRTERLRAIAEALEEIAIFVAMALLTYALIAVDTRAATPSARLDNDGTRYVSLSMARASDLRRRLWVTEEAMRQMDQAQCLPGRLQPADIARMVMFLAADDSAMCTAQYFIVDAGWT